MHKKQWLVCYSCRCQLLAET